MGSQVKGWFIGQGANPGGRQRGESCTIPPQDAQDDTVPCCSPTRLGSSEEKKKKSREK